MKDIPIIILLAIHAGTVFLSAGWLCRWMHHNTGPTEDGRSYDLNVLLSFCAGFVAAVFPPLGLWAAFVISRRAQYGWGFNRSIKPTY